ncbi:Shikimate kinase [subsurface metagenome]
MIEQKAGKSIPEIFRQDGETAFRELEIEATKEIAQGRNLVIACGGGLVLNKINIDRLRQGSIIVYLTASPKIILKRTSGGGGKRPLLNVPDQALEIRELLEFRKPFYERAADIKINTSKLDIVSAIEQIISRLKENESLNL